MPNNYFRFKQFIVFQDLCAMKVCTDACLFGAWIGEKIQRENFKIKNVLDIGAGTGLLSLMAAQKNSTIIVDAVEADEMAAQQAKNNFDSSPWKEKLHIHHVPIQRFSPTQKYELVISNPPFFENDLKSEDAKRNAALHSSQLTLKELIDAVALLMDDNGNFALLIPYHRTPYLEKIASAKNLYPEEKIFVKQTPQHHYFRTMLWLSKKKVAAVESEIVITGKNGKYTDAFTSLLKEYYLYL